MNLEMLTARRANDNDINIAFRIFLGRLPDVSEMTVHRGRSIGGLLEVLMFSDEHRDFVRSPLNKGEPFAADRFQTPPEKEDQAWLSTLPGVASQQQGSEGWRSLIHQALVRLGLAEEAELLRPVILCEPKAPASCEDVARAFQLVLGRAAELSAIQGHKGCETDYLFGALFRSEEFRINVVPAALEGKLVDECKSVGLIVLHWLRLRFGLDLPALSSRGQVLSALLRSPLLAAELNKPFLGWSRHAVIEMLQAKRRLIADEAVTSLIDRVQRLSAGVEILRIQNMDSEGGGCFRFTSNDPAVFFRLNADLVDAAAVELTFVIAGLRARGVLYLDSGSGHSENQAIPLGPRGQRSCRACILRPGLLSGLRWDPDSQPGSAWVVGIHARALQAEELESGLALLSRSELVGIGALSRDASDVLISRLLTQRAYGGDEGGQYTDWILANEPSPDSAQRVWAAEMAALPARPRIAVLVPLYNTPEPLLRDMIESVLNQVYPDWELCLADDASTAPHVRALVEEYLGHDERIRAVFREQNGHISEASNSALELVTADWVALLDHDDLLAPDALLAVAGEIGRHPQARFIYSDEDKIDERGRRFDVFFKPEFSPELLRSQNYLNHLSVHRAEAIRAVGGWRKGFEGSQDYDLNLRTLERVDPAEVRHVPRVLYHWRAVAGSTALAIGEKDYAVKAGLRALSEHLERMGWDATAAMIPGLPFYRVRYRVPDPAPLVSIVIPTRDRADLLATCVDSLLEKTDYPAYEVLIADNGSTQPETFALFERLTADPRVRVVDAAGPFNYSRINNDVVRGSSGELVCLLNNDIEVITPGWLTEMAAWALQPRIGCVGAKLYYPDDTIQHAGVILGIGGVAGHSHKTFPRESAGHFSRLKLAHDISAVTGACLLVRRAIWDEVEGLEEALTVAFNDVDFCLRVRQAGYRNLFTPFAELYHHESPSRGAEDSPEKVRRFQGEVARMMERWGDTLKNDPFYSPNLTLVHEDFSIAGV